MKHRYEILLSEQGRQLIVREYGELDKGLFTLLHEESFESKKLRGAMKTGSDSLVAALRAPHFYPTRFAVEKLAEAVQRILRSRKIDGLELLVDDAEIFSDSQGVSAPAEALKPDEEDEQEAEAFLEDDELEGIKGSSDSDEEADESESQDK